MVKASDSWLCQQHSAWQPPDLNCMSASQESRPPEYLPASINTGAHMFSAHMALPGFAVAGIPLMRTEKTNETFGLFQRRSSHLQTLLPTPSMYLKERQSAFSYGLGEKAVPNGNPGSFQKRFLIFDQSANQTRLIYNSVCLPIQNPATGAKPACGYNLHKEEHEAWEDKPTLLEGSDENHISDGESEMHEDTEEINALLYSDDEDTDNDSGNDDEITSTGHSPIAVNGSYEKRKEVEEMTEKAAISDGPNKRQKLLDGQYIKLSKLDNCHEYDSDAKSGYAIGKIQAEETGSILDINQSKKEKICQTLKVLESIIPRAKGKDPMLVLDEAIIYLKSLKLQAKTLGVNYH